MSLAFGLVLMLAVLLSERARRTVLSSSVLFLAAGFALGRQWLDWLPLAHQDDLLRDFAELALFAILFSDAALLPASELTGAWRLPGRALLLGMPLTQLGIAVAARLLLDMTWLEALLVGAILTPTDPVFIASILQRESVPMRLRRLLQVESGLNDGLALPVVMVLLGLAEHHEPHVGRILLETGLGVVLGVAVPWALLRLEGKFVFAASEEYRPLAGIAIACLLWGLSGPLHANKFLAAFAGGVTVVSVRPQLAAAFREVGRPIGESLKLATLLVFGSLLTFQQLRSPGWAGLALALLAIVAARPLALTLALKGGSLSRRECLAAAWFGPKGFASLLYALMVLHSGLSRANWLFHVTALVIVVSVLAHSSSDTLVARTFRNTGSAREPDEPNSGGTAAQQHFS